ncbi:MAG: homoserine dehydrogenase [Rhodospirillaceae bacterium]|nr:homoserine dehydrogenase [Rhodospirillaceae bacterium]
MMGTLGLGIAGLGTVGAGVVDVVKRHRDLLSCRCGRAIEITAVSARDRNRDRGVDLSGFRWADDASDLASDPEVDVVVELIGGEEGIALDLVETALKNGKHVVTANKALLAVHGTKLAELADSTGVHVGYEAAVAGGIPIIKALREGLAGNRISRVYGILNGTSNYIMTAMREDGWAFADVLAEAQRLGYAEADPTLDIGGGDAAHKLAIMASIAFRRPVDFDSVHVEGIQAITPMDIEFAQEFGYRIKLLGIAQETEHGIEQRVHPCMVPLSGPIAHVDGVFNAAVVEGDFVDATTYVGRGAGAGPTASAVMADVVDIARGTRLPMFNVSASELVASPAVSIDRRNGAYYIRLMVLDRPGVIADVSAVLRDENISLGSLIQRGRDPETQVPVVMTTHEAEEAAMRRALERIADLDSVTEAPMTIRIEEL